MKQDSVKFKAWKTSEMEPSDYLLKGTVTNWNPGRVGLRNSGAAARFDDVEVFPIVSVPSLTVWGIFALVLLLLVIGIIVRGHRLCLV